MLEYHVSQIELMRHMHKMDDFFGFILDGNRNYGKMAGVDYAEVYLAASWRRFSDGTFGSERTSFILIKK